MPPTILILGLGWLAGLWAASRIIQPGWAWLLLTALVIALLIWLRRAPRVRPALLWAVAFALGGARYQQSVPIFGPADLAYYAGAGAVALEGVVWDGPEPRETRTDLRLRVDTLLLAEAAAPVRVDGLVLVGAPRYAADRLEAAGGAEYQYGDRLRVFGQLDAPPEYADFSYREILARQGIHAQVARPRLTFLAARRGNPVWQALFDFKGRALRVLEQILPEPHAALLQGILLGAEAGIPQSLKDDFSTTGTSHIVAISG